VAGCLTRSLLLRDIVGRLPEDRLMQGAVEMELDLAIAMLVLK
jgi:hypothetical protein